MMDGGATPPQTQALTPRYPASAEPGIGASVRDGAISASAHESAAARLSWPGRLATPLCLGLLCLLSAAFFWKIVVLHQVLLPGDVLYAKDPLWRGLAPHSFSAPANPLDSDALTEFYPWTALAMQSLHHGTIPLWNPYAFAGTPFLGAMQTAVFYPVNLLLEWLAPTTGDVLSLRAIVHLAVLLLGTFLFARRLHLSRAAALLCAVTFGLGLPYMVWLEHPMAGAVAWLPWLLLCIEGVLATRGSLRWVAATSAVLALEALAGHGESTAHVMLLCTAYTAVRIVQGVRKDHHAGRNAPEGRWHGPHSLRLRSHGSASALRCQDGVSRQDARPAPPDRSRRALPCDRSRRLTLRPLLALATSLVIGFGIAAVQLAPSVAQIPLSEAAADRGAAPPVGVWGDPTLWHTLVVAIVPDFFGNPTWRVNLLPGGAGYNEVALYAGAVPLLLAALALLRRRDTPTIFFAVTALVALGMAVRLPLLGLLDNLPLLRVASNGRLRIEYAFAVAVLAGYGLDALTDAAPRTVARLARYWWLVTAAACAIGVILLLRAPSASLPTDLRAALPAVWLGLFVLLAWLRERGVAPAAALRWGAVALAAADLFALGVGYHTTVPRGMMAATPPAVRAVQRDHTLYRVAGLNDALWPSLSSLYGLQDVRGYDPAYDAAYERYFAASFQRSGMRLALDASGPSPAATRALDLMNVKYLFAACDVRLNLRFFQPAYRGDGCVYRNTTMMPRAVLVHSAQLAAPALAASLLGRGLVDPRHTALLDPATLGNATLPGTALVAQAVRPYRPPRRAPGTAGFQPSPGTTRGGAGTAHVALPAPAVAVRCHATAVAGSCRSFNREAMSDDVRVTRYGLNGVDLRVAAARRGVLVLADAYAPGWQARVDGRAVPIMRADAVFRAVAIGPGIHTVQFTYLPVTFQWGAAVSAAAFGLWLILLLVVGWRALTHGRRRAFAVPARGRL